MSSNSETNTPMPAVQQDRDREQVAGTTAEASAPEEKAPAVGSLAEEGAVASSAKPADSAEPESIAEKPADKKKPAAPAKKPAAAKKPAVAKKAAPKPLNKTCVSD